MLAILTTHPIQYQVPLWQKLAADGHVPFEVWYLSEHATKLSHDREFGTEFAWDIDMLSGYRYRILKTPVGATPNTFWRSRITESLPSLFRETKTKVLWVNGWQVAAYWQAVWAAHNAGVTEHGAELVVGQASQMGLPLWVSLGCEVVTRYRRYLAKPPR